MSELRVGTRGSELALSQTRQMCAALREHHADLEIEEIIIKTHGDQASDQPFDKDWPAGGFVGAIEQALVEGRIDFAVHSHKDLPTASPRELVVAAIPPREAVHDVLVTRQPVNLDDLPEGFVIATSSPRRIAQIKRLGAVTVVPIRGNVPTRIAKLERESLGGVILAAAGLRRLGLTPPHTIDLPVDRFVPAPAQGALAIQTRRRETAAEIVAALEHLPTRIAVDAERSFLWKIGAGCHVPVAAHATLDGETVHLRAQLFSDDGLRCAEGTHQGAVAVDVGCKLAVRLIGELEVTA